jgi:hypothetical protein
LIAAASRALRSRRGWPHELVFNTRDFRGFDQLGIGVPGPREFLEKPP